MWVRGGALLGIEGQICAYHHRMRHNGHSSLSLRGVTPWQTVITGILQSDARGSSAVATVRWDPMSPRVSRVDRRDAVQQRVPCQYSKFSLLPATLKWFRSLLLLRAMRVAQVYPEVYRDSDVEEVRGPKQGSM